MTRCGALALTLALLMTLGCSASDAAQQPADDPTTSQTAPTAPGGTTEPDSLPGPLDEMIDPCGLLTADEVERFLPGAQPGEPVGSAGCEWRQPDTEETITLNIGAVGTAADDVLDEPSDYGDTEPVPEIGDSARFVPGFGVVEFISAGRTCDVQVAVLGDGRDAAVAIAVLVRERL